jgi:ferredoxin
MCVPECPIDAIYYDEDVPENQQQFIQINALLSPKWPVIEGMKAGLDNAKEWEGVPDKIQYLAAFLDDDIEKKE